MCGVSNAEIGGPFLLSKLLGILKLPSNIDKLVKKPLKEFVLPFQQLVHK
jgi:hypothetical protein